MEATQRYNDAVASEGGKPDKAKPTPSGIELDPADIQRASINRELIAVMTDLKAEAISPGQATASVNVLKALAQVNGLITTEVTVTKKNVADMSTEELYAMLADKDTKLLDATALLDAEPDKTIK